jgi:hypothetical protein
MLDDQDLRDAPVGDPACSSTAAAQAIAGGRDLTQLQSRFFVVHARYDATTGEHVDSRSFEISDLDIAEVAGLDRERLAQLHLWQRGMIYESVFAGMDPEAAMRNVESGRIGN